MNDLPDFDTDDTGPIATAIELARTNPAAAAAATLPRLVAHEQQDNVRWRWVRYFAGVVIASLLMAAVAAATAQSERADIRSHQEDTAARLERIEQQTDARLAHIEQQIDRLMERTDR